MPTNHATGEFSLTLRRFLIAIARPLYVHDPLGVDLDQTYTLRLHDHRPVPICVSVGEVSQPQSSRKDAYLVGPARQYPHFIRISDGKVHDVNILDEIMPEAGAFYVMDRGYIDFERLFMFTLGSASSSYAHQSETSCCSGATPIRRHATGVALRSHRHPAVFCIRLCLPRCASPRHFDVEKKTLQVPHQQLHFPAIRSLKSTSHGGPVELFFKWIKQHLRIKAFYGTSENAVKTQIWIAVSDLCARRHPREAAGAGASLFRILQVLSVTLFEKTPILQAFRRVHSQEKLDVIFNQLNLPDL